MYGGISSIEEQSQSDREVVSLALICWGCIPDCIFACGARESKYNHEYVKDSSLDTLDESGPDPVPLCELVEGLHNCEVQTQRIAGNTFSFVLISGGLDLVFDPLD